MIHQKIITNIIHSGADFPKFRFIRFAFYSNVIFFSLSGGDSALQLNHRAVSIARRFTPLQVVFMAFLAHIVGFMLFWRFPG